MLMDTCTSIGLRNDSLACPCFEMHLLCCMVWQGTCHFALWQPLVSLVAYDCACRIVVSDMHMQDCNISASMHAMTWKPVILSVFDRFKLQGYICQHSADNPLFMQLRLECSHPGVCTPLSNGCNKVISTRTGLLRPHALLRQYAIT